MVAENPVGRRGVLLDEHPIPNSYWVIPGRLLAGEYPCSLDEPQARWKARRLLEAGVDYFVDLTEADEYGLRPYRELVRVEAQRLGYRPHFLRHAIRDMDTPGPTEMREILDSLETALSVGHSVYIHCFGGIGRTGTVVGCFLRRQGLTGEEALDRIATLRQGTPAGFRRSPETEAQRRMVIEWEG